MPHGPPPAVKAHGTIDTLVLPVGALVAKPEHAVRLPPILVACLFEAVDAVVDDGAQLGVPPGVTKTDDRAVQLGADATAIGVDHSGGAAVLAGRGGWRATVVGRRQAVARGAAVARGVDGGECVCKKTSLPSKTSPRLPPPPRPASLVQT